MFEDAGLSVSAGLASASKHKLTLSLLQLTHHPYLLKLTDEGGDQVKQQLTRQLDQLHRADYAHNRISARKLCVSLVAPAADTTAFARMDGKINALQVMQDDLAQPVPERSPSNSGTSTSRDPEAEPSTLAVHARILDLSDAVSLGDLTHRQRAWLIARDVAQLERVLAQLDDGEGEE